MFALIVGTTYAQTEGTAAVNAAIVSPITISNGTALNFGTINGTPTGGDVTVSFNGNRTFSNPDMQITSATAITAAAFSITAADAYIYSISIPDITLSETGGQTMDVTFAHNRNGVARRTGDGTGQILNVGGTLTVNDAQTAGSYAGTVTVTVAYE